MIKVYKRQELRMLPDLYKKIQSAAKINRRSLNAEILHRLEYSFTDEQTLRRLELLEEDLRNVKETAGELLDMKLRRVR